MQHGDTANRRRCDSTPVCPQTHTPLSRFLFEKVIIAHTIKNIPIFYETRKSPSLDPTLRKSTPTHPIILRSVLILSSHLRLVVQMVSSPGVFEHLFIYFLFLQSKCGTCPTRITFIYLNALTSLFEIQIVMFGIMWGISCILPLFLPQVHIFSSALLFSNTLNMIFVFPLISSNIYRRGAA